MVIGYVQPWVFRMLDSKWTSDSYNTQKKNMNLYIDLYSGPDFLIHFRYSVLLNIAFVCMMYGLGIPFLFFIAFLSFVFLWVTERYLIAYYFKLPPSFDDKLTKNALAILKWAVVFFLAFGYWMMSNK